MSLICEIAYQAIKSEATILLRERMRQGRGLSLTAVITIFKRRTLVKMTRQDELSGSNDIIFGTVSGKEVPLLEDI